MAILLSDKAAAGVQPRANIGVNTVTGEYNLSAALALNDVIQMVKIPAGATVLDVIVVSDDVDTNGVPAVTYDVGDGVAPAYYMSGSAIGQVGGIGRMDAVGAHPKTYAAEDTIDITVSAAPATAAVVGNISLTAFYTMDK